MKTQTSLLCLLSVLAMDARAQSNPLPGTLFMTYEQRQALDTRRMESPSQQSRGQLNGIVKRSSGRNSVWIDQRIRTETDGELPLAHTVGVSLADRARDR